MNRPPISNRPIDPKNFYDEKPFNTDEWVSRYSNEDGVWRTTKGYIRIVDMEFRHLSSVIGFVERRDPHYRKSKVWAALVLEYHKRDRPKEPEPAEEQKLKRKFRLERE